MIEIIILLISSALVWIALLWVITAIFSSRMRHPHRRVRDMAPVTDVSIRLSPKLFYSLIPLSAGVFILFVVPSLVDPVADFKSVDLSQLKSLSIFILSTIVAYLYLVRNTTIDD